MAKTLSRTVSIYINGKEVEASLKNIRAEIKKLENEQAKLPIGTDEYVAKSKELQRLNSIIKEQKEAVKGLNSTWDQASVKLTTFANVIQAVQSIMQMGDAAVGSVKDLVNDAAELDDAYADVMKTTGLTHKQVESLNETFKKMDTRTSREQLNLLAYEAGKLGINTEETVAQFVSAADKINIALGDVLGEGAMVTIGKVADVYSKSTDQLRQKDLEGQLLAIGSAVNSLGQASTANESYLVEFMSRMGGIATQSGLSADKILAFASALDQANQPVEMSATALQRLVGQMIKKPEEFIRAANMSLSEFKTMVSEDMYTAVMKVLEGMEKMGGFTELLPMFQDMGLDGQRAASVVATLAGSLDKVSEAQKIASDELQTGNSVLAEFATKNNSMAAQAEKAKKAFQDMRVELGEQLYPVVTHLTKASTSALKGLSGYISLWKENKVAAVALTTAMGSLIAMMLKSYVVKAKNAALDIAETTRTKINNALTSQRTSITLRNTAAREKNKLSVLQQKLAIEQKIIADNIESKSMASGIAVMQAEVNARRLAAQVTKQQVIATEASVAAQQAQKAAFASTPWGLVITAIAAIAAGLAKLYTNATAVRRETKELNKQIGTESSAANYLFDRLEKLDSKTDEYKSTLKQLNDLYPEILQKYTDEQGKLTDLVSARQAVIDKIREQITEQRKLDKYGEIAGDFSASREDALSRMRTYLLKDKGQKQGELMYQQLLKRLPSDFSREYTNAELYGIVESVTGIDLGKKFGWDGLERAIGNYCAALRTAREETNKWKKVYGDDQGSSWNAFSVPMPTGSSSSEKTPLETIIPNPEDTDAKNNIDKWQSVVDAANNLITDFTNKGKTGVDQLFAEVDAKTQGIIKRINDNKEASSKQKQALIDDVNEAANAYKSVKLDEYIKRINDQLDGKFSESSTNPLLDKVRNATTALQAELAKIDAAIAQVNADLQVNGLSEDKRNQLQALIDKYNRLKSQMMKTAYNGIDTTVDSSTFAFSGDRKADTKAYDDLINKIVRAKEAAIELSRVASDPQARDEYIKQAEALAAEEERLRKMMDSYDEFIKKLERTKAFDKLINTIETFANEATKIFSNINTLLDNLAETELQNQEEIRDKSIESLDKQLEAGYISQQQYEEKKAALEETYDEKKKALALEQWRREKALSLSEATIAGALAIMRVWSEKGNGTTAMRAVQTALVAASTVAQIAAIAATPKPYAQGGYVPSRTYFMAGEAGSEWVASNRLLSDRSTAPIISALERYQRGDNQALNSISMDTVSSATTTSVARYRSEQNALSTAMLTELHELNTYLSDPNNRRAVISRKTQEVFEANENFLRQQARL